MESARKRDRREEGEGERTADGDQKGDRRTGGGKGIPEPVIGDTQNQPGIGTSGPVQVDTRDARKSQLCVPQTDREPSIGRACSPPTSVFCVLVPGRLDRPLGAAEHR